MTSPQSGSDPVGTPLQTSEPVGGLLAMEVGDELTLGDFDDYGELEMGEADGEDARVALTFGASDTLAGTGAWDLGDIQELVVNETKGDFGGEGDASRDDAMVMEEEWDPDIEMFMAVWEDGQGNVKLERRIKRRRASQAVLLPYGMIAGVLLILGGIAAAGVVTLVVLALLAPAKMSIAEEAAAAKAPVVEVDHQRIEEAGKKTAEEILQEVLGDEE